MKLAIFFIDDNAEGRGGRPLTSATGRTWWFAFGGAARGSEQVSFWLSLKEKSTPKKNQDFLTRGVEREVGAPSGL